MNPVPYWFGVVCAIFGGAIVLYVCVKMMREWSGVPDRFRDLIQQAHLAQHAIIESEANDEVLGEAAFLVRAIISKSHVRDQESVAALLEKLHALAGRVGGDAEE